MIRHRRLRQTAQLRNLVAEARVHPDMLMMPFFVADGEGVEEEIDAMPGVGRRSVDLLLPKIREVYDLGVRSVLLFGVPDACKKDAVGSEAANDYGCVQNAVRAIKKEFPQMVVACDICLCEYTDHGHCGLVKDGVILNDETLPHLAAAAVSCARAGADIVAPSDMMDGRVAALREALDRNGFHNAIIMAYSAKYASSFYGPFRDAAGSAPSFGDRRTYQMDPRGAREGMSELFSDVEEGADILMVKPALAYLDMLARASSATTLPLATYNVSGEYSMVKAAAQNGWIDERKVVMEMMTSFVRAGANIIITYFAADVCRWLKEDEAAR